MTARTGPGVKFSDAELVGIPFRITIGKRGLASGTAELTDRATGETVAVPLDELAKHVREAVTQALAATSRIARPAAHSSRTPNGPGGASRGRSRVCLASSPTAAVAGLVAQGAGDLVAALD